MDAVDSGIIFCGRGGYFWAENIPGADDEGGSAL